MAKALEALLEFDRAQYARIIARLEHASSYTAADIRLSIAIHQKLNAIYEELHLDPHDTIDIELYGALIARLLADDDVFRLRLGLERQSAHSHKLQLLIDVIHAQYSGVKTPQIKRSRLKKILKEVPPVRTMKQLKLRSIESVLRKHDPAMVYALAHGYEPQSWKRQITAMQRRLSATDLEDAPLSLRVVPNAWFDRLDSGAQKNTQKLITTFLEVGTVFVSPQLQLTRAGSAIAAAALMIDAYQTALNESLMHRVETLRNSGSFMLLSDAQQSRTQKRIVVHGTHIPLQSVYRIMLSLIHI